MKISSRLSRLIWSTVKAPQQANARTTGIVTQKSVAWRRPSFQVRSPGLPISVRSGRTT